MLSRLAREYAEWRQCCHAVPQEAESSALKLAEEVGELCAAVYRGNVPGIIDAFADIVISAMSFPAIYSFDAEEVVDRVWREVRQRDYVKWPRHGRPA